MSLPIGYQERFLEIVDDCRNPADAGGATLTATELGRKIAIAKGDPNGVIKYKNRIRYWNAREFKSRIQKLPFECGS